MNVILQGVVGSTAYGLATPESDIDRLGVFQTPTADLLSLHSPKESYVSTSPDVTHHELGKFLRLCLANNPTVMELLWLDEYEVIVGVGHRLIELRHHLLSQRVRKTYGGYAQSQYERLLRREGAEPGAGFSSDLKKRTEKHGRHCFRLILQGTNILREGVLRVRLTSEEVQMCREAGLMAANDLDGFGLAVKAAMGEFDATETQLPEHPDEDVANSMLVFARILGLTPPESTQP